ncbi:MAG: 5-carboxymethyl-2-hydroxymuconate Delta-isomerase [candidate division Zixibacteria bacterium]|nr:5-carboxymethyl-2-hydroxymuconate Delta-isomerase [candidate division Zixibacteria bacterium]
MPHCILEYSNNVLDVPDMRTLLQEINDTLAATELFNRDDIKSRAIRHDLVVVGDGAPDRTFVTLTVQILSGRDDETKASLSDQTLAVLKRAFPQTLEKTRCSITVQIREIHRPSYRRVISY